MPSKTKVASLRIKVFLSKAGREISSGVHEILSDLVSEAVKKAIRGRHACRILFLFGLL
ncbi:MAG: DUF2321 domain-containing protein [Tissierellia bacterium]|nr:DUF2321 domain-containing protein [Tissierellia bacterium]